MADQGIHPRSRFGLAVNGTCFVAVIDELSEATSKQSALSTRAKAIELVEQAVRSYEETFGRGEVGARGLGLVRRRCPGSLEHATGLVYGRVQSGKTNAAVATVALASANGFQCFVVLTSDNTWLGKQTTERFVRQLGKGDGPVVRSWEDWRADPDGFAESVRPYLRDTGIVLISTKNTTNLETLAGVLRVLGAAQVPGMILDDEADNASLNTNAARMAKGKASSPSAIFAAIGLIRRCMPNHVYVQITATPQSLLLQGLDHPLRPGWVVMIEPGEGYIGGEHFFCNGSKHVVTVNGSEIGELRAGKVNTGAVRSIPDGLGRAVCFFVTASALHQLRTGTAEVLSMLIHIDHKKISHEAVKTVLTRYLMWLDQALRSKLSSNDQRTAVMQVHAAYAELGRTHTDLPEMGLVLERLRSTLRTAQPQIINADNPNRKPEYHRGVNFLIGGNRLGRGVTIEGLAVTYYGRDARTKMMDTVHQHARMFGYRGSILPITRLYSPEHILKALTDIYQSDEGTRRLLERDGSLIVKPVWVGETLRPTRANVLNPADLCAVVGGKQLSPTRLIHTRRRLQSILPQLERQLAPFTDRNKYYKISLRDMSRILKLMPSTRTPDRTWDDDRIQEVLKAMQTKPLRISHGLLNVRRGANGDEGYHIDERAQHDSGFVDGRLITELGARFPDNPVLLLRKQAGLRQHGWSGHAFYAPTLIVPNTKFVFVFSMARP